MLECLCLVVYKSFKFIYVQVIDDFFGQILVQVSLWEFVISFGVEGSVGSVFVVKVVGKVVVECVKEKGIEIVVFDCGGFIYYGKICVIVEGVCEVGFEF